MSNWFGLTKGKYIGEPPLYVDKDKKPGMTNLPEPTLVSWLQKAPFILITTPNFVWASISLLFYYYAPYDLSAESTAALAPISYGFLSERLPLWGSLTLGYFSFWHISLYGFNLASRPFIENRIYKVEKVLHNIFWTSSGIIIWTVFENVICFLWASSRLSYINDLTSFTTFNGATRFLLTLMLIPLWRSIHFYFAHRLLHYKALYQQVHSLHHRNTDTEPFSGLCMHPVEHLYYYSCILPSLIVYCSPYTFVWNGVHLLLSPGASHSGYEDHFQSDLFHYLHHRYFECNYAGSDAAFLDIWFDTFKGSFSEHPLDKDGPKQRDDAKSNLLILPTKEFISYIGLSSLCVLPWSYVSIYLIPVTNVQALIISLLVGVGPIFMATVLTYGCKLSNTIDSLSSHTFHFAIGTFLCSFPITYMCWLSITT